MTAISIQSQAHPAQPLPSAPTQVVVLELNELCPVLMDRFIADGLLPNFSRLRDASQVYVSDAEEAAPNLEPWIQWVTVHSGLSFGEHGIFTLGDGHKLTVPSVWDIASAAGMRVWVCGSMNAKYDQPINGAVVPDPWSAKSTPYPDEFAPYFRFVQSHVQEHTNSSFTLSKADVFRFMRFMAGHGLSLDTTRSIASQLLTERLTGKYRWKRATLLDKLQRDLFLHTFRKLQPNLSTFFLNSTAHFQHLYWRNMDPEPFKVKPSQDEQAEYSDAVLHGYREMDRIVGDIVSAIPPNAVIILATALSQQPCLIYEETGGKTFYRPQAFDALLRFVGVERFATIEPVMSEQFHVHFDTESEAERAAARLSGLRLDGEEVMFVELKKMSVFTGCKIFNQIETPDAVLKAADGRTIPFFSLFYQVEGLKSGMHHPAGILWIRAPGLSPAVHAQRAPLRDLAPTILAFLGIEKPRHMSGRALLPSSVAPIPLAS